MLCTRGFVKASESPELIYYNYSSLELLQLLTTKIGAWLPHHMIPYLEAMCKFIGYFENLLMDIYVEIF